MAEDDRTRRWQRIDKPTAASDTIQVLRLSIAEVRKARIGLEETTQPFER